MTSRTSLQLAVDIVERDLRAAGESERSLQMASYMKDYFRFLGVASPARKQIQKPLLAEARRADADAVLAATERCWRIEERELQYVGADLLRARASILRHFVAAHDDVLSALTKREATKHL